MSRATGRAMSRASRVRARRRGARALAARSSRRERALLARLLVPRVALSVVVFGALGGCTTAGDILSVSDVKPWERDVLAREDMQLTVDAMDDAVDDHLYFSKEASRGGGSVRGGGCGCN